MIITFMDFNKWMKRSIAFLSDIITTFISWYGACWLATTFHLEATTSAISISTIVFIQSLAFILCGLYRGIWRYASIPDLIRIVKAVILGTTLSILLLEVKEIHVPFKAYIIYALLLLVILSGTRLLFRWLRDSRTYFAAGKRILIVGAGNAGEGIIRDLYRSQTVHKFLPIGIVDDDTTRLGSEVRGVRVLGACSDIPSIVAKYKIELILIAIPSATSKRMREVVQYCDAAKVPFRTLPGIRDITDGCVTVNSVREVLLDDLLGREQVDLEWDAIKKSIHNKTILVTGGGGSIGSELCRQITQLAPAALIIVDNNEYNLYAIEMELSAKCDLPLFMLTCAILLINQQ